VDFRRCWQSHAAYPEWLGTNNTKRDPVIWRLSFIGVFNDLRLGESQCKKNPEPIVGTMLSKIEQCLGQCFLAFFERPALRCGKVAE